MSQSKRLALKLKKGEEIRKVIDPPETFEALRQLFQTLYDSVDFQVKYEDEEGDMITVDSDADLRTAYETATGPSLKLILFPIAPKPKTEPEPPPRIERPPCIIQTIGKKVGEWCNRKKQEVSKAQQQKDQFVQRLVYQEVCRLTGMPLTPVHEHVKCNGCGCAPLTGIRFKCTQCPDFDFCELCEADTDHPHPFLKITHPVTGPDFTTSRVVPGYQGDFLPKAEIVSQHWNSEDIVTAGDRVYRSWTLRNTGGSVWPTGSRLVFQRGEVYGETIEVPVPQPGQEVTIGLNVNVPPSEGHFRGVFALVNLRGTTFGPELVVELTAARDNRVQKQK